MGRWEGEGGWVERVGEGGWVGGLRGRVREGWLGGWVGIEGGRLRGWVENVCC